MDHEPVVKSFNAHVRTAMGWLAYAVVVLIVIAACLSGWVVERNLNWRYSYGPKVEKRLGELEKRVEKLEEAR